MEAQVAKRISRRNFMAGASAGTASLLGINPPIAARAQPPATAEEPCKEQAAISTKADRHPHPPHARFSELPLTSIQPQGWLRAFMVKAKNGLTGHLDELGGTPFDTYGWGGRTLANIPPDWWSYEQNAYWCDGMTRCGYLLDD